MLGRLDEVTAWAARLERYPTIIGTAPVRRSVNVGAPHIAMAGWDARYTANVTAGSAHQYTVKNYDVGQNGSGASQTNGLAAFRFAERFRMYEIGGALATLTAANRRKELTCTSTGGAGVMNISLQNGPAWRVNISGGSGGTKTLAVSDPRGLGANFDAAVGAAPTTRFDVEYASATSGNNGICRVWINGMYQPSISWDPDTATGHGNTDVINRFTIGTEEVGNLGSAVVGSWVEVFRIMDTLGDPMGFSLDDGLPLGLVQLADSEPGRQLFLLHAPRGMLGWANVWARLLWWPGPASVWPGDGVVNETDAVELTDEYVGTGVAEALGFPQGQMVSYKVLLQDDPNTPVNEWVSDFYLCRKSCIAHTDHVTPIRLAHIFCAQQDGFSRPFDAYEVADDRLQDNEYGQILETEDARLYSDSRDIDDSAPSDLYPYGRYDLPNQDSSAPMPAGSARDIILCQREGWCDPLSSRACTRQGSRKGGGDHLRDNSWNTSWIGDGSNAPPPWYEFGVGISRGEVSARAQKLIDNVYAPACINLRSPNGLDGVTRYGRGVQALWLDPISYRTSASMLGAAQKAYMLDAIRNCSAPVLLVSTMGGPFFDALYKTGQDWQDDSDWRDERDELAEAIDDNPAVRWVLWNFADLHGGLLSLRGRTGASNYSGYTSPKMLAEFGVGAAANNLVSTTLLASVAYPGAPGVPIADWTALENLSGVVWVSMQGQLPGSPPPYVRQYGEILYDPMQHRITLSAIDARRLSPPIDRVLQSWTFDLRDGRIVSLRGRGRELRSRQVMPFLKG